MLTKIAISEFKAHCLEIVDKMQIRKQPIVITKRGKPIAKLVPYDTIKPTLFGMLKERAEIRSDIVGPIDESWSAEHE